MRCFNYQFWIIRDNSAPMYNGLSFGFARRRRSHFAQQSVRSNTSVGQLRRHERARMAVSPHPLASAMQSFVFNVDKLQHHQLHQAHRHNARLRPTRSQLPRESWFTPEGKSTAVAWDASRLAAAHKLAKRKDAVEAISFVIQFGDQTDWRDAPDRTDKCGKPKPKADWPVNLTEAGEAIQRWTAQEFGQGNVVSLDLHFDESTPHFHLVVTPVHDGKLQVKHWLNGPASIAALRKRAHAEISKTVACTYQPGEVGGAAHDPRKAAGAEHARQPEVEVGFIGRLKGDDVRQENEQLWAENARLKAELKAAQQAARLADKQRLRRDEERELRKQAELVEPLRNERSKLYVEIGNLKQKLEHSQFMLDQLRPEELGEVARRANITLSTQAEVEHMEAKRGTGEISDQDVADWLVAHDVERRQKVYRQYVGCENEVLALVEGQKRAKIAPQQPGRAEPPRQRRDAPERDSGPSLG